ncbi:hypothetical protein MTBBW1_1270044 [Desulfamplus magnetovallimortis]|uniref:histidine kinase n=1 Tax=Desulfamplus magnetovallimortis TaxID=1246637 RepID=A0A1W1H6X5_9BACT|nr:PAS domain S-box protein [Desulfamplus magnetovallimortis]SLM28194.1 hypothetical protein MTBBW1_1270044 [Desulfamplus magnetovallimortis]
MILNFYKKMSNRIAYRLLFYILLFSGIVTLFITAIQLLIEYKRDTRVIDDQFQRIETSFKQPLIEALWFFNKKGLQSQLEGILNLRDIEYIELTGESNINIKIGEKISKFNIEKQIPLIYESRIISRQIGNLTVVASMSSVYSRLSSRLITILIAQSLKTFLVTTFIYILFHFLLIKHILLISSYLKHFDFKDKPKLLALPREGIDFNDELSQMISSINEMTLYLYSSYQKISYELLMRQKAEEHLQKAHDELEHIVEERTKSLKEERDHAQTYLDIAAVIMVAIAPDQKVILINKKGCSILGYDEKDIIGTNWFERFVPKNEKSQAAEVFRRIMAGEIESVEYFENSIVTKSGKERMIAWNNTIMMDNDANIIATLSSGNDITERKQAEEERENLIKKLKAALEKVNVLSGLIPICSHCKKIRDDKGYWNILESYIQKHSDASFSHGICPDCSDQLYGHEDWYIQMKKKKRNSHV